MIELLSRPALAVPILLLITYFFYHALVKPPKLPNLPIIGARDGDWFPFQQAKWRNTLSLKAGLLDGHRRYKDQAVVVPVLNRSFVMLPLSEAQWFYNQPDNVFSFHHSVVESLQLHYNVMDSRLAHDTANGSLVTKNMTGGLDQILPKVIAESRHGFEKLWGDRPGESKEVNVVDSLMRIVTGITVGFIIGAPLCRDDDFIELSMACAQDWGLTSQVLSHLWEPLRPIFAPIVTLPGKIRQRRYKRAVAPEVHRRLALWDARAALGPKAAEEDKEEPNDFLQWAIRYAKNSGDPRLCEPDMIIGRMLMLNFAAIHTSTLSLTSAIIEFAAGDPAVPAELRAEVAATVAEHGWTRRSLARMEKLDSALRESARLNSFITVGSMRSVEAPGGIVTPSGVRLSRGTNVCLPVYAVLHDENVYPDAESYRPWRFSEARRAAADAGGGKEGGSSSSSYVERARNALPTTKLEFLAFGHGRHACPGRFFAALELKTMMAQILLDYEIAPRKKTPSMWFSLNRVPDMMAKVRVCRREKS